MIQSMAIFMVLGGLLGCAPKHYVTVREDAVAMHLQAPRATAVQFASSMDHFTLHPLRRDSDGSWVIRGLSNREFQYFYLVDGKVVIPDCRFRENDDFGAANCRYIPQFAVALHN